MNNKFLKLFVVTAVLGFTACEDEEIDSQRYNLDEANSSIIWKGYGQEVFHDGSFAVKGQDIEVVNGILQSGTFTIPIASIQNFDLPAEVKPVLLTHLKSADFFNMVIHPEAKFKIMEVDPVTNSATSNEFIVTGDFTMLGQTHSINFPAVIKLEGNKLDFDAEFEINRTHWGMNYAADPELGEHHIKPEVDIKLDISAIHQ